MQTTFWSFNLFLYIHVTLISSSLFVQIPDHSRWITLKDIHKDSKNVILSQIEALLFLIWKKNPSVSSPPHQPNRGQNYTTPKANSSLSLFLSHKQKEHQQERLSYDSSGKCTASWIVAKSMIYPNGQIWDTKDQNKIRYAKDSLAASHNTHPWEVKMRRVSSIEVYHNSQIWILPWATNQARNWTLLGTSS